MNRVKQSIFSLTLLLVILLGGGLLSPYIAICNECIESSEHHHCCSCSDHIDDCHTHNTQVAHNCVAEYSISLEYISIAKVTTVTDSRALIYMLKSATVQSPENIFCHKHRSSVIFNRDDDIKDQYLISARALRAPPVCYI